MNTIQQGILVVGAGVCVLGLLDVLVEHWAHKLTKRTEELRVARALLDISHARAMRMHELFQADIAAVLEDTKPQ